jgi:hypothetical protein
MASHQQRSTIGIGSPKRNKYGGMESQELKRMRELESENARLKNRTAEAVVSRQEH